MPDYVGTGENCGTVAYTQIGTKQRKKPGPYNERGWSGREWARSIKDEIHYYSNFTLSTSMKKNVKRRVSCS